MKEIVVIIIIIIVMQRMQSMGYADFHKQSFYLQVHGGLQVAK